MHAAITMITAATRSRAGARPRFIADGCACWLRGTRPLDLRARGLYEARRASACSPYAETGIVPLCAAAVPARLEATRAVAQLVLDALCSED